MGQFWRDMLAFRRSLPFNQRCDFDFGAAMIVGAVVIPPAVIAAGLLGWLGP